MQTNLRLPTVRNVHPMFLNPLASILDCDTNIFDCDTHQTLVQWLRDAVCRPVFRFTGWRGIDDVLVWEVNAVSCRFMPTKYHECRA